jgi:hypothetical protein
MSMVRLSALVVAHNEQDHLEHCLKTLNGHPDFLMANVRRLFTRFFKCYVGRRRYREGKWGFLIALFAGFYPLLSYLKATLEPE